MIKLLFINSFLGYRLNSALRTQLQGSAHSAANYYASAHSTVESSPTLQPKDTLYTASQSLRPLIPFYFIFSIIYLIHLEPRSIYTIPWSSDHG